MTRHEKLETLLSKLKEKQIFEIRQDLEAFLQEDDDQDTNTLQKAISDKLDNVPFHFTSFDDFLSDYKKNNHTDPAGNAEFHSRIHGEY